MKKLLFLFVSLAIFATSCTYKTCPTYAKEKPGQNTESERS